jgi:hypothetical protein
VVAREILSASAAWLAPTFHCDLNKGHRRTVYGLFVFKVQAVEKGSSASLRSIASLDVQKEYACARRFIARLAPETFLTGLQANF